ncbi:hypothetical protein H5410_055905 [Solanum commersonii]|uniref:Uncharacterized protein n=1 Tax=Solanum commersonii TaxID=4109 RepID=A0A9J5WIU2_SOLCO|nr:hypothetical protein H5410_055905 [Solanum commersonii]
MARDRGVDAYSEIMREFYASYLATLRGSISKRSKPLARDPPLPHWLRVLTVDISLPATHRRISMVLSRVTL